MVTFKRYGIALNTKTRFSVTKFAIYFFKKIFFKLIWKFITLYTSSDIVLALQTCLIYFLEEIY